MSAAETALIGHVPDPALHVMSWNIRRRTFALHPRRADRWKRRAPGLRTLLQTERPTLLGVQEALPDQARFVAEALGGAHDSVGHGRGPHGGGEASPIYYDAERLELLDWEQRALSDTPHHPGSRTWGNLIPRSLVTARFRDRATATDFLALNTHLDHLSHRSRLRSVQNIKELVTTSALPVVLMGDMNADLESAPVQELLRGQALADTWAVAAQRESQQWGTFPNYRAPRLDRGRIDWVMVSPTVEVLRAAINPTRHAGGWASDHLPVQAVLHLPPRGGSA
ncbi:endonuclease/exonuclease/phosphatase family protein [Nesterenkonia sandarakina]|uniref:Endonuclease/exonuclease/phosphatase family metal-dependent hydrolase n=1 Tax=Nesterenkonia sandarakina TaxID=272918 RepID=A0A2T0YEA3_9MICC|nr:endonuclease/exonuclease/phosphatase family protein [Nesterenkonia sandarakina]PRZ13185.1 endonuclease/exonuclease/phosphatase family metal-dependent hydrolase [Nesterenkonia sandarakina]